jgi:hypothetical protein
MSELRTRLIPDVRLTDGELFHFVIVNNSTQLCHEIYTQAGWILNGAPIERVAYSATDQTALSNIRDHDPRVQASRSMVIAGIEVTFVSVLPQWG